MLWAITGAGLMVAAGVVASSGCIGQRLDSKENAWRSPDRPRSSPVAPPQSILQLESHTCGFLALSAAYVAYGLSPEDKNLRFRLGTDRTAHPFDDESTGTLHPDIFRVLEQDGFGFWLIDPDDAHAETMLGEHIRSGQLALVLIKLRASAGLHWVLVDDVPSTVETLSPTLRVVDSLRDEPTLEEIGPFLRQCVLSIIALEASGAAGEACTVYKDLYAEGIAEMNRVHGRMKSR